MNNFEKNLLEITERCREDMHEPDEQGISAHVVGTHLDNAFGEEIIENLLEKNCQEFIVIIKDDKGRVEKFNLATLVAYARAGIKSGFSI